MERRRSSDRTGSAPRRGPAEWQELPTNRLNQKMTVSVESVDADYSRQERWTQSKHGAYMRKAKDYSVYYYGSPSAREEKRREFRQQLQAQMKEDQKKSKPPSTGEYEEAVQKDSAAKEQDARELVEKAVFLKTFKKANKTLMEMKAEQRRLERQARWEEERELLKHNPINWSASLK